MDPKNERCEGSRVGIEMLVAPSNLGLNVDFWGYFCEKKGRRRSFYRMKGMGWN